MTAGRFSTTIGANVRAERARRGWTQDDLAERLKVSRGTVSNIEVARHAMSADLIPDLCRVFGVSIGVLLYGADESDIEALRGIQHGVPHSSGAQGASGAARPGPAAPAARQAVGPDPAGGPEPASDALDEALSHPS